MFGTLSRPHLNPNLQTHMPWGVRVVVGHASTTVFFYFFIRSVYKSCIVVPACVSRPSHTSIYIYNESNTVHDHDQKNCKAR
jgi:hypothetical protein